MKRVLKNELRQLMEPAPPPCPDRTQDTGAKPAGSAAAAGCGKKGTAYGAGAKQTSVIVN